MWRIQIREAEKDRLIRENAINLGGFLHPDLVERAKKIANYNPIPPPTGYMDDLKQKYFEIS